MKTRDFLKLLVMMLAVPFVFAACSDDDGPVPSPTPEPTPVPDPEPDYSVPADQQGLFVFNGGNQGSIDGSLSFINFSKQEVSNNVFAAKNNRSLGATVQNGAVFKGALFIAVYDSKTIEVVDKLTLESIKQITTPSTSNGPRYVVADDQYVYASLYSGEVIRINPATNEIDKTISVGPNPEEMVIANGFLYVVNSDGLNYQNGYVNGKSVSKIDLSSFTEVKKIEVGVNPTRIATDGTNVYALSTGDYTPENPSSIWKIDAQDNATDTGIGASWLAVQDGVLYTINSVFDENWMTTNYYITYNLSDMSVNSSAFLGENVVDAPAGICIDAEGGNLFVSSYNLAYGYASYDTEGYVNQYDLNGNLVKKYDVGVGPCFMTVLR